MAISGSPDTFFTMFTTQNSAATTAAPPMYYLLRCGSQSNLIRMSAGARRFIRGAKVLVRTERGLEIAEVLAESDEDSAFAGPVATYVRQAGPEDHLLWNQLSLLSLEAANRCQEFLDQNNLPDVLIEAEPLMDGRTLYFHFLGEPTIEAESFVQQLASVYQESVSKSQFAQLLETGCGPGCGTAEKSGCGTSGGCAVCAIAGGCQSKKARSQA